MSTNNIIEIREGKKLKLHNVLTKELTEKEVNEFSRTIQVFQEHLKARAIHPMGPLITYTTPYLEDGLLRNKITLITQLSVSLHNEPKYPLSYYDELIVSNCLFARLIGPQIYSYLANYKLQVYAFENNFKLKGSTYTVYSGNNEDNVTVDVFAEIENE